MIGILEVVTAVDPHIIPDPAVLVHDRISDITAMANANGWQSMRPRLIDLFDRLVEIHPHQVAADDRRTRTDAGADPDNAVLDPRGVDNTSFGDDRFLQGRTAYLG